MANVIKHKQTATPSKVPTTGDLQLGELAVNTYDGKLFLKKDDGTPSIVEIGAGAGSSHLPGMLIIYAGSSAPTGWLFCDGSPVSRTTYASLFSAIGTTYGAGDGSTTFNVPDLRGRVVAGVDNMGGSDAGRLDWANTLGTFGGAQTHTLTTAEMPSHTHIQDSHNHTQNSHTHIQDSHNHTQNAHTHIQNAHTHTQDAHAHTTTQSYAYLRGGSQNEAGGGQGYAWHLDTQGVNAAIATNQNTTATNQNTTATNNATTATNQSTTATNQATTATNQNTGGGGAHNNMQPTILLNYIIKT